MVERREELVDSLRSKGIANFGSIKRFALCLVPRPVIGNVMKVKARPVSTGQGRRLERPQDPV